MVLHVAVPLFLVIGGIISLMVAMTPSGIQNTFAQTDPPGATEAQTWPTSGNGGLTLTVENALETRYDAYFDEYTYMTKCQASGALSLVFRRLDHEVVGDPSEGRLNVCNDNCMDKRRGLTVTFLQNGVVWATAKLNGYVLGSEGSVQQRYTYVICRLFGNDSRGLENLETFGTRVIARPGASAVTVPT
jgi:hypothetical protein